MHDYSRDEFRRAVREADAVHRETLPAFQEAIKRSFDPDAPVRGRRALLRTGGLALVGAVALAACSDDEPAATDGTTPAGGGAPTAGDVSLATAAIQIENTAVAAYTAVATIRGADLPAEVAAAATLFSGHHAQHAQALNAILTSNGAAAVPADQLFAGLTLPDQATIESADLPTLGGVARGLEHAAAATYVEATPQLSLPILRQAIMGIGGAEARHVTAWDILLGGGVGGYDAALVVGGNYPTDASLLP